MASGCPPLAGVLSETKLAVNKARSVCGCLLGTSLRCLTSDVCPLCSPVVYFCPPKKIMRLSGTKIRQGHLFSGTDTRSCTSRCGGWVGLPQEPRSTRSSHSLLRSVDRWICCSLKKSSDFVTWIPSFHVSGGAGGFRSACLHVENFLLVDGELWKWTGRVLGQAGWRWFPCRISQWWGF